jgi:glycosylphosphatidylinositol transamidase
MMFGGLRIWSDSAWIPDSSEKEGESSGKWIQRSRPVMPVLGIMLSTHILGAVIFSVLTTSWFNNHQMVVYILPFGWMTR